MDKIFLYDVVNQNWKKIGYNLKRSTFLMNITTFVLFNLLLVTVILGGLVLVLDEINTNTIADAFEICGPYSQVIIKMLITKFSMSKVHKMLQQMKDKFWAANKFGPKFEYELLQLKKLANKYFSVFSYLCYICIIVIMLRPVLFLQSRKYPLMIYNIIDANNNYYYFTMYGLQICNLITGAFILLSVDGLFILFITNICVQLHMLKHGFSSLKFHLIDEIDELDDEYISHLKIIEYVKHHNMIINFIKDFTNLVSFQMLNQFIGNTISICMGVYIVSTGSSTDLSASLKALTIIIVFIVELCLFCTGGTLITELILKSSISFYTLMNTVNVKNDN